MMQFNALCFTVLQKTKTNWRNKWGEEKARGASQKEKDNENKCRKEKIVVLLPRDMKLEKDIR